MAALLLGSLLLGAHPALAQSTDPPIVTILAPASPVYTSRPSVDVSGVVDSRVAIVEVTWTSDRGGQGAASGTTTWSAEGVPLEPGWNELVVTARDLLGNIATAAVSVVYEASPSTSRIAAPLTGATPTSIITWSTVTSPAAGAAPSPPRTAAAASPAAGRSPAGITLPAGGDPGDVQLITGGPVAAYGFDEGSGPTVADLSGNDNTGTLHGTVDWTSEGKFGSALVFHGSGFVTVPSSASLDLTSGMTLEAWVYPTAMSTGGGTAIMKEQPGQLVYALRAGSSTGRPRAEINLSAEAAGERALTGPAIVPLHAWTHLASTYDGSTLRLYVNGVFVASRGVSRDPDVVDRRSRRGRRRQCGHVPARPDHEGGNELRLRRPGGAVGGDDVRPRHDQAGAPILAGDGPDGLPARVPQPDAPA